jgi:hypothetical protein
MFQYLRYILIGEDGSSFILLLQKSIPNEFLLQPIDRKLLDERVDIPILNGVIGMVNFYFPN